MWVFKYGTSFHICSVGLFLGIITLLLNNNLYMKGKKSCSTGTLEIRSGKRQFEQHA